MFAGVCVCEDKCEGVCEGMCGDACERVYDL